MVIKDFKTAVRDNKIFTSKNKIDIKICVILTGQNETS